MREIRQMTRMLWLVGWMMGVALLGAWQGKAAVYSFSGNGAGSYTAGWNGSAALPDYDASGVLFGLDFGSAAKVSGVEVSVKISGGWNGDIYAYLSHGSDFAVLLNRAGVSATDSEGYSGKGFDVRLVSGGADVHWYEANGGQMNGSGQLMGDWGADGRLNATDTERLRTLSVFNGSEAQGSWRLMFADLGSGGGVATVESWSVTVTAVPEPWVWGMGSALGLVGVCLGREARRRRSRTRTTEGAQGKVSQSVI